MNSPKAVDSEGEIFFNDRQENVAARPIEDAAISKSNEKDQFDPVYIAAIVKEVYRQQQANQESGSSLDCESDRRLQPTYQQAYHSSMIPVQQKANVKIPSFTGKEDWSVWLARFEAIARRHRWTEDDKLDNLFPLIEGKAAEFVYSQLPATVLNDYKELVRELNSRYRVIETPRLYAVQFGRREQKTSESAEEYAAELKTLYFKAYGHRDRRTREEDLVRRFMDGLRDEEMRFDVEYHKEPQTIDEAVYHVVNYMQTRYSRNSREFARHVHEEHQTATDMQEDQRDERIGRMQNTRNYNPHKADRKGKLCEPTDADTLSIMMKTILEKFEKMEKDSGSRQKEVECYSCRKRGHYSRDCPDNTRNPLNCQGPALKAEERSS